MAWAYLEAAAVVSERGVMGIQAPFRLSTSSIPFHRSHLQDRPRRQPGRRRKIEAGFGRQSTMRRRLPTTTVLI